MSFPNKLLRISIEQHIAMNIVILELEYGLDAGFASDFYIYIMCTIQMNCNIL